MGSGVTMEIEASETIPGALTAVPHVQSKLQSKYKVTGEIYCSTEHK